MRTNPGRKEARAEAHALGKKGDRNRKSGHKLRTHDGIVLSKNFKRTPRGLKEV